MRLKESEEFLMTEKEPSLEEMKKMIERHGASTTDMNEEDIRFIYSYVKKLPDIKRAEEDSLAGQS